MDVYEPEEDSYLLAKQVKKEVTKGMQVLEIGIGSGIQCEEALKKGAIVEGVDINPNAIKHCKESKYTKGGTFYKSDLFSNVKKSTKFDCIIFNPPYLPDANDPDDIKDITTGGKKGYEIIDRFLKDTNEFLAEDGFILLLFSSHTNKTMVDEIIKNYLFDFELLEDQSVFYEKLYCYKITKSSLLNKLTANKITQLSYLSKGKRGIVFKGKFGRKDCVVKVSNEKSDALSTTQLESLNLKRANKLGIGPQFFCEDEEYVCMEFIDGELIEPYFERTKDCVVIKKIMNQMLILDKNNLEKKEMTRPRKHIIVRKECKNYNPIMIDFERMHATPKPRNVTQFIQYIRKLEIISEEKAKEVSERYKKSYDKKLILDLMKEFF